MKPTAPIAAGPQQIDASSSRHPRVLYTLFFTEMWERFSYYGMRALLVLFMVDSARGGMGLSDKVAASIYGLYTAAVYLAALPGGWIADRILGARRAVWYGGMIIAAGHFTLAIPGNRTFYPGLLLVVAGTGLLKPNVSAMVGELYPEGGARRDAGFSIFYMGINLGAFLGPLVCGTLGEKHNWHYGFGAAGIGMVLGLLQYRLSLRNLAEAGRGTSHADKPGRPRTIAMAVAGAAVVFVLGLAISGVIHLDPVRLAAGTTTALVSVAVLYFGLVLSLGKFQPGERKRLGVIIILCAASALFWAGFEQAGSSFNLFAERYTRRDFGFVIPASWFQSIGPIFVITLAPVAGAGWVKLARRNLDPSTPLKFAFGLVLLGLGFLVMAGAAVFVARGQKVWPTWLILTYLLHTFGELCVSPVGLSSVTKLSPRRFVGQMMGAWFLATSLGNLIAGRIAGEFNPAALHEMPCRFLQMVILPVAVGFMMFVLVKPIRKMITG